MGLRDDIAKGTHDVPERDPRVAAIFYDNKLTDEEKRAKLSALAPELKEIDRINLKGYMEVLANAREDARAYEQETSEVTPE